MACYQYFLGLFETLFAPDEVAAVIMEPIQGDAGIIIPPLAYMKKIYDFCKENGILFISEEVQSGMGRTGRWFGSEHFNLEPDILIIGKALASGLPLSALVPGMTYSMPGPPRSCFSTCNPICCAAALATISNTQGRSPEKTAAMGNYIRNA